jgi:hypothetical protein
MTRIEGFWIYWGGEHYVWAEREAAPKHKYRFEVSADWKPIVTRARATLLARSDDVIE